MTQMRIWLIFLVTLSVLPVSGCGKGPRREGLGGGATTPVSIKLLLDEAPEKEIEPPENSDEEKATTFGTLRGHIHLQGTESELAALRASLNLPASPEQASLGLPNTFVYLAGQPNADLPSVPQEAVQINFENGEFAPKAAILRVGQTLKASYKDKGQALFEIQSATKSARKPVSAKEGLFETVFEEAEPFPVQLTNQKEPRRISSLLVINHPWGAVSNENGAFEIQGVPAGERKFIIWHERRGQLSAPLTVEIPANESVEKEISVKATDLLN